MNPNLVLSVKEVRSLDQAATEEFGIPSLTLMENAGTAVAQHIIRLIQNGKGPHVYIFCGKGNNGGDGFVVARVLFDNNISVEVILLTKPFKLKGDAEINYNQIRELGIPVQETFPQISRGAILVDAILGTGFSGELKPEIKFWIDQINRSKNEKGAYVVAVDIPSGMSGDEGLVEGSTIKANDTLTFAALKTGIIKKESNSFVGNVKIIDIGIPDELYDRVKRRRES